MWRNLWIVIIILSLSALLVPACGGDDDEETSVVSPAITNIQTTTPTANNTGPTDTPTTSVPVKIGAINSWSGPAALSGTGMADPVIKLVEKQVKDQGGILGGREVNVVRYDNRASVAEAQAGAKKLYYDDKVSAITIGGISGAEFTATADASEELGILFVSIANVEELSKYKFTVNATVQLEEYARVVTNLLNNVLKPETVVMLGSDDSGPHTQMPMIKEGIEADGTKVVSLEYFSISTNDFSSYLTKIKYENPDVLYFHTGVNEIYITIAKQMMELGGWGDIKVVASPAGESAKNQAGAQGWYMFANTAPGLDYPGTVKFNDEFQAVNGRAPVSSQVYYYNSLWTAIYAVELAGTDTDRVAIAQAARSRNLEWDTPMGHCQFQPDGTSGLHCVIEQIVDKNLVYVPIPE